MTDAKANGDAAFRAKNYQEAVKQYTAAIAADAQNHALYSNRSAAHLKLGHNKAALEDAEKCIEMSPDFAKGYLRKGQALFKQEKFDEACGVYATGLEKDPQNKALSDARDQALAAGMGGGQKTKGGKKNRKKNKKNKQKGPQSRVHEGVTDDAQYKAVTDDEYVIGIDLGTTNSCVAVWKEDGKASGVVIIPTETGDRTIPSYVSFDSETGERKIGMAAKNQATRNPNNTFYDVKRVIGQRFTDTGVEADCRRFGFATQVDEKSGKPMMIVNQPNGEPAKRMHAEEISALVLTKCKTVAEDYLKVPVTKAVVTVPAYFNDAQRNATKAAGKIAGLEVLRIINEPTAAALAYGMDSTQKEQDSKRKVLIFDLGGGTFDVSILSIEKGIFTVLATGGDTRLGGEDFDNVTLDFINGIMEQQGIEGATKDPRALQRLRKSTEQAKRELSNSSKAEMKLDAIMGNKNFKYTLTREQFEKLNRAKFNMTIETVRKVLKDAKLKTKDIDDLVLVGGSTRIPKIQELLAELFDRTVEDLSKAVNPDEAVAYGAAVQGAILNGKRNEKTDNLLLLDVTPLSLGIETTGRVMSVIIPRNTAIPCVRTQTYTTENNYQTQVDVAVYEGERLKSDENNLLGEFTISNIENAKRGEPQIDVSFSIDADGILDVTAIDQKTRSKAKITISNRSKVSNDEIEQMIRDAAASRKDDEERIKRMEAKNALEATIVEVLDIAAEIDDNKLAKILEDAAAKEQAFLEHEADTAKVAEIALRRRNLDRRIENRRGMRGF